jgi:hypothetical protein
MNERFSPGSAIVGLVFIALGTLFLLDEYDVVRLRPALVLPILLVGLGLGLLAGVREPRRHVPRVD